ncbi:MAG: hypothetical protein ACRET0_10200 [Steroidobacteraceae bacterium]
MTSQTAVHLTRLSIQLLLMPVLMLLIPLLLMVAWVHEVIGDLAARGQPLGG